MRCRDEARSGMTWVERREGTRVRRPPVQISVISSSLKSTSCSGETVACVSFRVVDPDGADPDSRQDTG